LKPGPGARTGPAPVTAPEHSAASTEWHRSLVRRTLRRRLEVATYAGGLCSIVVMWSLGRWGLVAHRPLWLYVCVFAAVGIAGWLIDRFHNQRPNRLTAQLRSALPAFGVTVIIYLIGWGPALGVGYVFPMLNMTFYRATRRALHLALWPLLGLAAGQVLVATGVVHLLLGERSSFALAALGAISVVFVSFLIAQVAAGKEEAERDLAYAASHDLVTGLMNRAAFTDSLARLVAASRRNHWPVAVLFCDLLGFKRVNDLLGHDAGDQALIEAGRRIAASMRAEDLVARFGGDEFVVALAAPQGESDPLSVADRVLSALAEPLDVNGTPVHLGCSIGVAYCTSAHPDLNGLLTEADTAMYKAKALGRPGRVLHSVA
jgi:diguanylate cyclase (GGDEF)-like protein